MTVLQLLSLSFCVHLRKLEGYGTSSEFSSTLAKMGAADDHDDGESFLRVSLCDEGRSTCSHSSPQPQDGGGLAVHVL